MTVANDRNGDRNRTELPAIFGDFGPFGWDVKVPKKHKKNPQNQRYIVVLGVLWRSKRDLNSRAGFPTYALSRGALFYKIIVAALKFGIGDVMEQEWKKLSSAVSMKLYALEFSPRRDAYWYVMACMERLQEDPRMLMCTQKILFREVADEYDTNAESVGNSIRRAIQRAWDKGLFDVPKRPTPAQLLSMLLIELAEEEPTT